MAHLQKRLLQNGGPYFLGKHISIADLYFFGVISFLINGGYDFIPGSIFQEQYPKMYDLYRLVGEHPIAQAELKAGKAKL